MGLTAQERFGAAEILRIAEDTVVAVAPRVQTIPHLDVADTYIQRRPAAADGAP